MQEFPDETLLSVLCFLDPGADLVAACLTCHRWRGLIQSQEWARGVFGRLFGDQFLGDVLEDHQRVFMRLEDHEGGAEELPGAALSLRYREARSDGNYLWLLRHHWRRRHMRLDGLWRGHYGPHGWEYLHVQQRGFEFAAVKLTGDPNVPAGAETFRLLLECSMRVGAGRIQLADHGFLHRRFGVANVVVESPARMVVYWLFDPTDPESFVIPTEMFRCKTSVDQIMRILELEEKDEWGNVDARRLKIE